jgi:hypothetical protein
MNEGFENSFEPSSDYRFVDPAYDQEGAAITGSSYSVEFYPSIDDLVHITQATRKTYKLPFVSQYALQTFLFINMIGFPATLWFFGWFLAGLLVLALNLGIAGLFIPAIVKADYRRFFTTLYGNFENEIVRVEISERGLGSSHLGDSSFHLWKNVKRIEESSDSIFFYLANGRGIAVRKSGFAYDLQKNEFLGFARQQLKSLQLNDTADRS